MKQFAVLPAALAAALSLAPAASANEFEPQLRELASTTLAAIARDPALIAAIKQQNAANAGLSQADIDALDKKWRAEVGASDAPLISSVLATDVSAALRGRKDAAGGLITEVFAMDNHGLNVAQSDVTSDYWQGDEAKWQQTFGAGAGAIHIGDVELDESTQIYQSQVSLAIVDETGTNVIGAITFGVNVEAM